MQKKKGKDNTAEQKVIRPKLEYAIIDDAFNDIKEYKFKIKGNQSWDLNGMRKLADRINLKRRLQNSTTFEYNRAFYENDTDNRFIEDLFENVFEIEYGTTNQIKIKDNFWNNQNEENGFQKILKEKLIEAEWNNLKQYQIESENDKPSNTEETDEIPDLAKSLAKLYKNSDGFILKYCKKKELINRFEKQIFDYRKDPPENSFKKKQTKLTPEEKERIMLRTDNPILGKDALLFKQELEKELEKIALSKLKIYKCEINELPSWLNQNGMEKTCC
jgi:hypothetical protein